MQKTILFLSALDFKNKSIQVIRKTPEAYVAAGWNVHYVVARDNSKHSNYFYEEVIDVKSVKTYRFNWPFQPIRDFISSRFPLLMLTKLISLIVIIRLALIGAKILFSNRVDVIYGYELHGVLAMNVLKPFCIFRRIKTVSRFQGTFLNEMIEARQYGRILFNLDLLLALWLPSNLCIMTNDGTRGDCALNKIKSRNRLVLKFWVNGVDLHMSESSSVTILKERHHLSGIPVFLSISRLVKWKRVDRAIKALFELKNKYNFTQFKYLLVGEGQERENLESLVKDLGLVDNVLFIGSVPNTEVKNYLEVADYFISTYDSSNVGNPLLEAIRAKKVIYTLNNGDTSSWIRHRVNGFIYNLDDNLHESMAKDMNEVIQDAVLHEFIVKNVKETASTSLWLWEERFQAELNAVEGLLVR